MAIARIDHIQIARPTMYPDEKFIDLSDYTALFRKSGRKNEGRKETQYYTREQWNVPRRPMSEHQVDDPLLWN